MSETSRFYTDGRPNSVEHAFSSLSNGFGAPTREEAERWMRAADVHATLAQVEAMQDLARSNRELSASYDSLVDELRARRGVPERAE